MKKMFYFFMLLPIFIQANCIPEKLFENDIFRLIYVGQNKINIENTSSSVEDKICFDNKNINLRALYFDYYKFDLLDENTCDWTKLLGRVSRDRCQWIGTSKLGEYCRFDATHRASLDYNYDEKKFKKIIGQVEFVELKKLLKEVMPYIRPSSLIRGQSKVFKFISGSSIDEFSREKFDELINETLIDVRSKLKNEYKYSSVDVKKLEYKLKKLKSKLDNIHQIIKQKVKDHVFPTMKRHPAYYLMRLYEENFSKCIKKYKGYFSANVDTDIVNKLRGNSFGGISEDVLKVQVDGFTVESEKLIYRRIFEKNLVTNSYTPFVQSAFSNFRLSGKRWSRNPKIKSDKCNPVLGMFGFGLDNKDLRDRFYLNACRSMRNFEKSPNYYVEYNGLFNFKPVIPKDTSKIQMDSKLMKKISLIFDQYLNIDPFNLDEVKFYCRRSNLRNENQKFGKISLLVGKNVDNVLEALDNCLFITKNVSTYLNMKLEEGKISKKYFSNWHYYFNCMNYKYDKRLDEYPELNLPKSCEDSKVVLDFDTSGPLWNPEYEKKDFEIYNSYLLSSIKLNSNGETLGEDWKFWLTLMSNKHKTSSQCINRVEQNNKVAFGSDYCVSTPIKVSPNLFADE